MDVSFKVEQDLGTLHQDLQSDKLGKMNNYLSFTHMQFLSIPNLSGGLSGYQNLPSV